MLYKYLIYNQCFFLLQLLVALKVRYPQRITILRGNHESRQVGNLAAPVAEWIVGRIPLTSLMDVEMRHGRNSKPKRWDVVTKPKAIRGLGVCNLKFHNLSLLAKWWRRALTDNNALWRNGILAIQNISLPAPNRLASGTCSGVWSGIAKIGADFTSFRIDLEAQFSRKVGVGHQTRF
ncbi:putative protein-serine/threonine phosphatase [Helianthus annuus]|uniref:uncharacterized protein LOC110936986 n=1 Tax=Helianthus annuus TaxID=4232 RepID=UPI001652C15D|nr:uncharacterized protein LOC110936986 [Helianthus annuus]KAJ0927290.1 putative protein-serine/threonine phosphatase [Helianthus annuus]